MGGCQNYGPLRGTLNIKGSIILTTTHVGASHRPEEVLGSGFRGSEVRCCAAAAAVTGTEMIKGLPRVWGLGILACRDLRDFRV